MSEQKKQLSLDEVIEAYLASVKEPNKDSLAEWVQLYPQYAQELMDFVAHWSLLKWIPPHENLIEDEEALVTRGMSVLQNVLYQQQKQVLAKEEAPLVTLIGEAKKRGIMLEHLAKTSELTMPLIAMLERRLIIYSSIPRKAIENIAQVLGRSVASVSLYLQMDAGFSSAHHKADGKLKLAEQQDFFDAIRSDRTISEELRQQWLLFTHDNK